MQSVIPKAAKFLITLMNNTTRPRGRGSCYSGCRGLAAPRYLVTSFPRPTFMEVMKNLKYFFLTVLVSHTYFSFCQITPPATPKFPETSSSYYYYSATNSTQNTQYTQTTNLGATYDNLNQQTNSQAMRMMGYNPPSVPPSDPNLAHQFILNQYNSQNASKSKYGLSQKELSEALNEIHSDYEKFDNTSSNNHTQVLGAYKLAHSKIVNMLNGKSKLSYADANYYLESAYGNTYMNYDEFKSNISQSADFIKKWMAQNNLQSTPQSIHYAIQQFMGDTMKLTINLPDSKKSTQTTIHLPFKYDYDDYDGELDYRNYFSSKCLATGTGQCNSMPIVYLMLCEAMGVKGYLSFAPFHSFIKYKNPEGKIINYEPTSHWTIPDKWYQDNLGVNMKAKANGVYLDTLNRKQAIANTLVDLAISYMQNNSKVDTAFVLKCLEDAQKYFPKGNNLYLHLAKSSLLYRQLDIALRKHGINDLNKVPLYPDTQSYYNRLVHNEALLAKMGYQAMPQNIYDDMIEHQKNKTNSEDAKTKKSLFKKTN